MSTYGLWTPTGEVVSTKRGAKWLCECSCGRRRWVAAQRLRNGASTSCGHEKQAQRRESQTRRGDCRMLTIGSETKCVAQWARQVPHSHSLIRYRLRQGWSPVAAVFTPCGTRY